ncbi:MAG: hypothetical protein ACD_39C01501G0002 [uncultured bacterium]|nr:MAG: hypothetical protein ACD_39C01501G0002 [uncultured bacterium]
MPFIRIAFLTVICCLFMNSSAVQALSPQVRLPEWNRTSFAISEWKPDQGILVISVSVEASQVGLSKISSQLHAPEQLNIPVDRHERATLAKGDKAVFLHKVNVKEGFAGWFELDVRAQPEQSEMLALVAEKHAKEPLTCKILEEEIRTIEQPIYIGTSLPVLLRKDVALNTVPEAAFSNDLEQSDRKYYLWYPPEGLGKGITAEGLKTYSAALRTASLAKSESAARMLLRKIETSNEPIGIEKTDGETFMLPAKVAADLISANQLTMRAVTGAKPEILQKHLNTMQPGYSRPFLYYNLAVLESSLKKRALAIKYLETALAEQPAWPLAEKLLKQLKK